MSLTGEFIESSIFLCHNCVKFTFLNFLPESRVLKRKNLSLLSGRGLLLWWLCFIAFVSVKAERLPVKIYTSADGLGSSFISYMMTDSRSFLWFATRDGLSRFDGQQFVTYQIGAKDAPPGIEQILEAGNKTYWIMTTGGLYRFNPQSDLTTASPTKNADGRATLDAEFISNERGYLYEDREGDLWVGLNKIDLTTDEKPTLRPIKLNLPVNRAREFIVFDIDEGRDGSFWICTSWGLARRLPDERIIFYDLDASLADAINSLIEDKDGRIWMTRTSGLYVFQPETLEELSASASLTVRKLDALSQIQPKRIGDVRLPEKSGEIFKFVGDDGFTKGAVASVYQTSD